MKLWVAVYSCSIALYSLGCGSEDSGTNGSPGSGGSSGSGGSATGGSGNAASGGTSSGGNGGSAGSGNTSSGGASGSGTGGATGTLITFQDMDEADLPSDWSIGAQAGGTVSISENASDNYAGSAGSLKGTYPVASGGVYVWGAYDLSGLALSDLYIEFRAKMPAAKQGLKFLKIFGKDTNGAYANTTFALDYTGVDLGGMYQVSFGDGSGTGNDTANVINFDGQNPEWIGRSFGTASVQTPQNALWASSNWGTDWHHFRIRAKFNTGSSASDEVADGAYHVEIDGKVYVDATGLFNRHWSNGPIDRVELFGWAQNGSEPFELWYDDVRLSIGGFL